MIGLLLVDALKNRTQGSQPALKPVVRMMQRSVWSPATENEHLSCKLTIT